MTSDRWEQSHAADWRESALDSPRDERDLLLEAALEAARLLGLAMPAHRDDPDFLKAANETIRRIYAIYAVRAHDG